MYQPQWAMGLGRAAGVALVSCLVADAARCAATRASRRWQRFAWVLVILPLLTPLLLVGYAYSRMALALARFASLRELVYAMLLVFRFAPIGIMVRHVVPSALSQEALFLSGQLTRPTPRRGRFRAWARLWFLTEGRGMLLTFAAVFVLSFSELELASLLFIDDQWAVRVFDAQTGGWPLRETLRMSLPAVVCQLAIIVPLVHVLASHLGRPGRWSRPVRGGRFSSAVGWLYLTAAAICFTVIPGGVVLRGAVQGVGLLIREFALGLDILASLFFAAGGAWLACFLGGLVLAAARVARGKTGGGIVVLALVPGLLGSLVVALMVLRVFQWPVASWLNRTPLPLLIGLGVTGLPVAVALSAACRVRIDPEALGMTRLLVASPGHPGAGRLRGLVRKLSSRGHPFVVSILFTYAYYEMTGAAILAPPGMTPVVVRLYNLMHYGQTPALSAMVLIALIPPVAVLIAAALVAVVPRRLN